MQKALKLSSGFKKYLRRQKASIRFNTLDIKEKEEKIKKLYQNLIKKDKK